MGSGQDCEAQYEEERTSDGSIPGTVPKSGNTPRWGSLTSRRFPPLIRPLAPSPRLLVRPSRDRRFQPPSPSIVRAFPNGIKRCGLRGRWQCQTLQAREPHKGKGESGGLCSALSICCHKIQHEAAFCMNHTGIAYQLLHEQLSGTVSHIG